MNKKSKSMKIYIYEVGIKKRQNFYKCNENQLFSRLNEINLLKTLFEKLTL